MLSFKNDGNIGHTEQGAKPRRIKENEVLNMEIRTNTTGDTRKKLVGEISHHQNAPTQYLGMPSAAYKVGDYVIDRQGTVTGPDDWELVCKLQDGHNFKPEAYEFDENPEEAAPCEPPTTEDAETTEDEDAPDRLTIEMPLDGFTPEKLDNLIKMVTAKEPLIKAALGADELPIQQTDGTLKFPWFRLGEGTDANAYAQFIAALCKTAKEKNRVTAKERDVDNPKYAMRCWLLSLGMIGEEYKAARKLLLAGLDGNGSFKGGSRPTYTANCYTYPSGSEEDAMDCETQEFTSLVKAKAHVDAFAADCESLKFAGAHVEDSGGKYLYEILTDGTVNEQ
ncbi:MAG: hypothetical protein LBB67_00490 [Oscillospiraceae bacterium]|nr:hypothetical protein [Oscillospiraceae bacterium]